MTFGPLVLMTFGPPDLMDSGSGQAPQNKPCTIEKKIVRGDENEVFGTSENNRDNTIK
jgi:hypothetical protein